MMFGRLACLTAMAAAFAAVATGAASAAPKPNWTCYTHAPSPADPTFAGLQQLAQGIEAASGGAIKVKCSVAGSLPIKESDITNGVSAGVIDVAGDLYFNGNIPVGSLLSVPGLFTNDKEFETGLAAMVPILEAKLAAKGVKLIGYYHYPLQVLWTTGKVAGLADLKSRKIRVSSAEQAEFIKRIGAVPVTLAGADVPVALQNGVVEGVITASAGGGRLWHDMLKYNMRLGPNYATGLFIVNKATFDSMPADLQAKVLELGKSAGNYITTTLASQEDDLTKQFEKAGMTVIQPSDADIKLMEDTMQAYWTEWAQKHGQEGADAMKVVRTAIGH